MAKAGWQGSRRILLILVALGLAGQGVVLSIHPPTVVISTASSEDPESGGHDGTSCEVCQFLSQVRAQASPPASPELPVIAPDRVSRVRAAVSFPFAAPTLQTAPRAPPRPRIS